MTHYTAKKHFALKEIAGEFLLMARGPEALDFSAVIVFNETGVFLWNALALPRTAEELAQLLAAQFSLSPAEVSGDVAAFLKKAEEEGLLCIE